MDKSKVFITGATGFLGAAILADLLKKGYEVLAAKRSTSNTYRCESFLSKINWVDTDDAQYTNKVINFNPAVILHAAWNGVAAKDRTNWQQQLQNFSLISDLLIIAQQVNIKKIIVLGSQAEYGNIDTKVDESFPDKGLDAYASCKRSVKTIIKSFCQQNNIDWYWLRVFSVFGPGEEQNWFIPWVIINQLKGVDSNLTPCEQLYDYLFIEDFTAMITQIISSAKSASGIYNICSGNPVTLKEVAESIHEQVGYNAKLNFGAISYRPNQSMYIAGDNSKYERIFGKVANLGLQEGLQKTIKHYKDYLLVNKAG